MNISLTSISRFTRVQPNQFEENLTDLQMLYQWSDWKQADDGAWISDGFWGKRPADLFWTLTLRCYCIRCPILASGLSNLVATLDRIRPCNHQESHKKGPIHTSV